MKTALCLFSLLFALACHAQLLVWETTVLIPFPLTNPPVVGDGLGGGAAVIFTTGSVARVVWFNSSGGYNLSHDVELPPTAANTNLAEVAAAYRRYRQNTGQYSDEQIAINAMADAFLAQPKPERGVNILRVTKKTIDFQVGSKLRRFTLYKPDTEIDLKTSEVLATLPPTIPDKRGFFTSEIGVDFVTFRRYSF